MGAYTYTSDSMGKIIPASRFCGVFDGQDLLFQPITSKQFSYDYSQYYLSLYLASNDIIRAIFHNITAFIYVSDEQ